MHSEGKIYTKAHLNKGLSAIMCCWAPDDCEYNIYKAHIIYLPHTHTI